MHQNEQHFNQNLDQLVQETNQLNLMNTEIVNKGYVEPS